MESQEAFSLSQTYGPAASNAQESSELPLDSRYILTRKTLQGAYAKTFFGIDKLDNQKIAIQQIHSPFSSPQASSRVLLDLKLRRLLQHTNIHPLQWIQLPISLEKFDQLITICHWKSFNLSQIYRHQLTDIHRQYIAYQIFRCVHFVHDSGVLLSSLNPGSFLLDRDCVLKLVHFNEAVVEGWEGDLGRRDNWGYRAPEQFLGWRVGKEVDVWAIGCMFVEMFLKRKLIMGENYMQQLELIFDLVGPLQGADLILLENMCDESFRQTVLSFNSQATNKLEKLMQNFDPLAYDLAQKLLKILPCQRISPKTALQHPYFQGINVKQLENGVKLPPFEFDFLNHRYSLQEIKRLIYEEILLYHCPELQQERDRIRRLHGIKMAGLL